MSQNHSATKAKRRQKSDHRKDTGAATMAKLKALSEAQKTKERLATHS